MFTGIIESVGQITSLNNKYGDVEIKIKYDSSCLNDISLGDSISINGVCLTAYNINKDSFAVDISNETLDVSSLTQINTGYKVNIETSLCLQDKLGGHLVSGHVDCIAQLIELHEDARSYRLGFKLSNNDYLKYIVKKGSICVDGVSLTVNKESDDSFFVNIIPFTWNNTIMQFYKLEAIVNIEVDRIALHVEKLLNNKG